MYTVILIAIIWHLDADTAVAVVHVIGTDRIELPHIVSIVDVHEIITIFWDVEVRHLLLRYSAPRIITMSSVRFCAIVLSEQRGQARRRVYEQEQRRGSKPTGARGWGRHVSRQLLVRLLWSDRGD